MAENAGIAAGWYHAPGDPDGTHRYWDGARWTTEAQQVQAAPTGFAAPTSGPPSAVVSSPGAAVSHAPPGYQPYAANTGSTTPAGYGQRVAAYLIDALVPFAVLIATVLLALVAAAVNDALGLVVIVVGYIVSIGVSIWNLLVRQGSTGQSIGKKQMDIALRNDATGGPPGGGMTFARYLVAGLLAGVTCGIYGLLDVLWPLWDADNTRLTDKIMKMSVVTT